MSYFVLQNIIKYK